MALQHRAPSEHPAPIGPEYVQVTTVAWDTPRCTSVAKPYGRFHIPGRGCLPRGRWGVDLQYDVFFSPPVGVPRAPRHGGRRPFFPSPGRQRARMAAPLFGAALVASTLLAPAAAVAAAAAAAGAARCAPPRRPRRRRRSLAAALLALRASRRGVQVRDRLGGGGRCRRGGVAAPRSAAAAAAAAEGAERVVAVGGGWSFALARARPPPGALVLLTHRLAGRARGAGEVWRARHDRRARAARPRRRGLTAGSMTRRTASLGGWIASGSHGLAAARCGRRSSAARGARPRRRRRQAVRAVARASRTAPRDGAGAASCSRWRCARCPTRGSRTRRPRAARGRRAPRPRDADAPPHALRRPPRESRGAVDARGRRG